MNLRNEKGQYVKGHKITVEEKLKQRESLKKSWKNRKNYIADIVNECPKIYGVWRGIMFTKKGKKVGISEEWKNFRNFYNDVRPSYIKGKVFRRKDSKKPHSADNFIWVTAEEAALLKQCTVTLEYNGDILTLKDWSEKLNESYYAIKNRYYKREKYKYSIEEILFGRKVKIRSKPVKDFTEKNLRTKTCKMVIAYRHKDKIRGYKCDIDTDWVINNIINKECIYCGDTHKIGCDRIDNTKGHTKDNVVPCCYECNVARGDNFTFEEMKIIGQAIRKVKELRNNKL